MTRLKWTGKYVDQRAGAFRVFWSAGAWTLQQSGRRVLRCDSRSYAKSKAGKLAASDCAPRRKGAATRKPAPRRKAEDATPPTWIRIGSIVDYCAIVGAEPTDRAMVVTDGPTQMGSGQWVVWLDGKASAVAACRPAASNDEPSAVQIEIRASELEPVMSGGVGRVSWAEHDGVRHHAKGADLNGSDELPGWLAAELATHEEREARDAYAWAWDIKRLIAAQDDPWMRPNEHDLRAAGLIAEQTRHDVAAAVARHADLPSESQLRVERCPITRCTLAGICVESPCSSYHRDPPIPATKFSEQLQQVTVPITRPGRVPYAEDQLPLPMVSDPCPDPATCTTCGDVPADLVDLPPPTPGEAGVLAARDAEPDCRDDDDEPLTPPQRAEVTRILSDASSDDPLAMSDPCGPTKLDADGKPYCDPAGAG